MTLDHPLDTQLDTLCGRMEKSTYEDMKKILVLLIAISVTAVVLQISMLHNRYNKSGGTTLEQIKYKLRTSSKRARQVTDTSRSPFTAKMVATLTNLSRQSNQTLENEQFQNKSLPLADWVHLMETRQRIRADRMNHFCKRANLSKLTTDEMLERKGLRSTLLVNDYYNVTFSFIKKVASNNFENLFKELGGIVRLYMLPDEMCRRPLEEYTRAIFVRHPLSRFLSAYKDKFVYHHIEHFTNIGRNIIAKYRKNVSREERAEAMKRADDVRFDEFFQYILSDHKFRKNTHWNVYWRRNRVCELRYDFIGKLETFHDDVRYMLYKIGVNDFSKLNIPSAYLTFHPAEREMLRSYYGRLPRETLRRIYDTYRRDFDVFGYSMNILGDDMWP